MKKTLLSLLAFAALFCLETVIAQCEADISFGTDVSGAITFTDNSSYNSSASSITTTLNISQGSFGVGGINDIWTDVSEILPSNVQATVEFPFNHEFIYEYLLEDNNTGCVDSIRGVFMFSISRQLAMLMSNSMNLKGQFLSMEYYRLV